MAVMFYLLLLSIKKNYIIMYVISNRKENENKNEDEKKRPKMKMKRRRSPDRPAMKISFSNYWCIGSPAINCTTSQPTSLLGGSL